MAILKRDKKIEYLETQGIMVAVNYTYSQWTKEQNNLDAMLRTATEAWLANVYNYCSDDYVEYDKCDAILSETLQYGEIHFKDQAYFLCMFGYMLKLFPYYFNCFDGNFDKWSQIGRQMIAAASQLEPEEVLIQAIRSLDENPRIFLPSDYFEGESEIEIYFRNILGAK